MKKIFTLLWFIIQIFLISGQEPKSYLNLIGGWNDGTCNAVCRTENILYVGNGSNLDIVDMTDPTSPVFITHFNCGFIVQLMQMNDNYLFVESEFNLIIFDISDIQSPVLISTTEIGMIIDVTIKDNYLYMIYAYQNLRIYDISDPMNVTLINNLSIGSVNYALCAEDNFIYLAAGLGCLRIIDVSDPLNPVFMGVVNFECYTEDLFVSDQIAYVANEECGLRIFDVSDPLEPLELACFQGIYGDKVIIMDTLAIVVNNVINIIYILDINNPANPFLVSWFPVNSWINSLLSFDNYLNIPNSDGLRIMDIKDPYNPVFLSFYDTPFFAVHVAVEDDIAYVSEETDGIYFLDVSDPAEISVINHYNPGSSIYDGEVFDHKIYYSTTIPDTLNILDVSDPFQPVIIGSYSGMNNIHDFLVSDSLIFMTSYNNGQQYFKILNAADPTDISEISSYTSSNGFLSSISLDGNYAVVQKKYAELTLFDISNPYNVSFISQVVISPDPDFYISSLSCSENHVFLGNPDGLMIYNIEDPYNPYLEGEYELGQEIYSFEILGNHLMCSTYTRIVVLDITAISNPVFLEEFLTPSTVYNMCYSDSVLYGAAGFAGIWLFDYDSTGGTTGIHPEPDLSKDLPFYIINSGSNVIIKSQDMMDEITVFSITGEKIVQQNKISSVSAEISVAGFAGGSYIIRIRFVNGMVKSKKIIF